MLGVALVAMTYCTRSSAFALLAGVPGMHVHEHVCASKNRAFYISSLVHACMQHTHWPAGPSVPNQHRHAGQRLRTPVLRMVGGDGVGVGVGGEEGVESCSSKGVDFTGVRFSLYPKGEHIKETVKAAVSGISEVLSTNMLRCACCVFACACACVCVLCGRLTIELSAAGA